MKPSQSFRLREQDLWMSPDRTLFWEQARTLVVSDLHFGKTGHFRKSGLAVPQAVYREDLQRLISQIQYFEPERLLIVGDCFHSRYNQELEWFLRWRESFEEVQITLVKGNHDILEEAWYAKAGIQALEGTLEEGPFHFIHDIQREGEWKAAEQTGGERPYFFSGHIHPGVRLYGAARQSLCLPCFYFGHAFAVLPAFSRFTGLASVQAQKGEKIFAIADGRLLPIAE